MNAMVHQLERQNIAAREARAATIKLRAQKAKKQKLKRWSCLPIFSPPMNYLKNIFHGSIPLPD
jgi:hypothetical protein